MTSGSQPEAQAAVFSGTADMPERTTMNALHDKMIPIFGNRKAQGTQRSADDLVVQRSYVWPTVGWNVPAVPSTTQRHRDTNLKWARSNESKPTASTQTLALAAGR